MSLLHEMVKLIPRGRLNEWGGGGRNAADRGSDRGYRDDDDVQFVNRRKGKKVVKNIVVKEEKLEFHATGDMDRDHNSVWVLVMSNHPDDDRYDDYHGINVIFHQGGKVTSATADKVANAEWKAHKDEIIKVARAALNKNPRLKRHLGKTYAGDLSGDDED